jgi:hypothetical protein
MKKAARGVCRCSLVFLSISILPNWTDIFGQLFSGVLAFGLLGLAGFGRVRGLDRLSVQPSIFSGRVSDAASLKRRSHLCQCTECDAKEFRGVTVNAT